MSEGRVLQRKRDEGVAIAAVTGAATPLTGSLITSAPGSEIHGQQGQAEKARLGTSVRRRSIVLSMLPWGRVWCFSPSGSSGCFIGYSRWKATNCLCLPRLRHPFRKMPICSFDTRCIAEPKCWEVFARFIVGCSGGSGCIVLSNKRQGRGYGSVCT